MTPSAPSRASALAHRRIRRALAARTSDDDAAPGGELNIVPFLDVVTNLLLFLLATVSTVLVVSQVDARLRPLGPGRGADLARTVSVTLTEQGIVIAGPGGFVASGCATTTRSSTFAVPAGDYAALSECMERVRARVDDDRVIVSADPQIPYDALLHAMDAVRARGDRPLFPEILISAGVR